MNGRKTIGRPGRCGAALLAALAIAFATTRAGAQMTTPLHVGALQAIVDEFGATLQGNASSDPSARDLVQLLWASNSIIYPPAYDATPNPNNPPVTNGQSGIGTLTSPVMIQPGIFSAVLSNPRPAGGKLFVRVFNAPTLAGASFYADSQVLTISGNQILIAQFGGTTNALDGRDDDGDGLNNSWEKSLGSDAGRWDTDGDGVGDGDERRAGTDLLDPDSMFIVANLSPWGDNGLRIEWDSVAGKRYYVQYSTNDLPDEASYVDYDGMITGAPNTTISHKVAPNGRNQERVHIRVRLVEP
jgi:hypothetical protein